MTWILPSCCYVGTHPKLCIFRYNCSVIKFQFFSRKEIRLTYKRKRSRSLIGYLPEPQFSLSTYLLDIWTWIPRSYPKPSKLNALVSPFAPKWFPSQFPSPSAIPVLAVRCPEHPRISRACWVFPGTISHTPPFLSIPIAPRPLLLQAWLIIIAS